MKVKIPILASLTILVTLIAIPLATPRVQAINGNTVGSPNNVWGVTGPDPSLKNMIMQFYGDDVSELNAFQTGQLDIMDLGQGGSMPPVSGWAAYEANPDFLITPAQGGALYHGIYYNLDDTSDGSGTVWHTWGCPFQKGNSACGIEIRQAFAHLLDRPQYVANGPLQGGGVALADDVPPNKIDPNTLNPVASSLSNQCSWDTLYLANGINGVGYLAKYGTCLSAFNIAPDPSGFATPGSPDFCAAVDHLIRATQLAPSLGLARDAAAPLDAFGNHCGIDPASPGLANIAAHPMRAKVRSTEPRHTMGLSFSAAMNSLFAGNVVETIQVGGGGVLGAIVFFCCTGGRATDDWEWYTFGYQAANPYTTDAFGQFDSTFASDRCGGPLTIQPTDTTFVCIAALDTFLVNLATTLDTNVLYTNTYAALNVLGSHAIDLPAYAFSSRGSALRSVDGLVNQVGLSYENAYDFYTVHKSSYVPVNNPLYAFNHGGPADTVRRGEAGGGIVANLNPYFSQWVWEFDILGVVYDTLFAGSPTAPTQIFCWICVSFDTSGRDANGNEIIAITLKQNLHWQDGAPLTASDVAFSILTERDFSAVLSGNVNLVTNVHISGPLNLEVTYTGVAIDAPLAVGGTLLIPQHIFDSGDNHYGQGIGTPKAATLDPGYDPIAQGTFIGSGEFECASRFTSDFGKIGTGCVTNSDATRGGQSIGPGGSMFLTVYDNTASGASPFDQWFRLNNPSWGTGSGNAAFSGEYQAFSWADRYDNATTTSVDLAAVGACFGHTASGCADGNYWLRPFMHPGTPTVVSSELTFFAAHYTDSMTAPFSWNGVQYMQPGATLGNIAPFIGSCAAFNLAPNPLTSPCFP